MYHYIPAYLSDFLSIAKILRMIDKVLLFGMRNMINNWVYNNQKYEIISLNTSSQLHSSL